MITKIKQTCLFLAFTVLFSMGFMTLASAQKYTVAAGWRFSGVTRGIDVKVVPVDGFAVEGIVGFHPVGNSATLLLEKNRCLIFKSLQLYTGIGGHARWNVADGIYVGGPLSGTREFVTDPVANVGIGLDVIGGIEWKLPLLPAAISADVKPMVELTPNGSIMYGLDPGVGLKIVF